METEFIVGQKYSVCTGSIACNYTFRGVARKNTESNSLLVFENESAKEGQYRFIGARIEINMPYRVTSAIARVTGQLYGKYYGHSIEKLVRHGIPEEDWELA